MKALTVRQPYAELIVRGFKDVENRTRGTSHRGLLLIHSSLKMAGTGTVPGVAHALGRHGIGMDLSADYCKLAEWRIEHSGHFDKVHARTMADRQGRLL